ncbi:hypothetical protein COD86_19405 [Bacillus cereus]|nr:hypothetical protein COD14_10190 [Bacillus cereus]PGV92964.1 hypothetical protein COD86_19405 [Bacillus cereus]
MNIYLNEAIGAVNTHLKMANDFAFEDGDGKVVVNTKWFYKLDGDNFVVAVNSRGEELQLEFTKEEWNCPKANMLGNPKLDELVNNLIEKCKGEN